MSFWININFKNTKNEKILHSRTTAEMMEKFKDYKSKEEVVKIAMDCIMYGYNGLPNNLTPIQGMNKWLEENL